MNCIKGKKSEVDFIIEIKDYGIVPIEVKSSDNNQSKSLKIYDNLYKPKLKIRIGTKDFFYDETKKTKSILLYAVFLIEKLYNK